LCEHWRRGDQDRSDRVQQKSLHRTPRFVAVTVTLERASERSCADDRQREPPPIEPEPDDEPPAEPLDPVVPLEPLPIELEPLPIEPEPL
jgi:hypothetical protein